MPLELKLGILKIFKSMLIINQNIGYFQSLLIKVSVNKLMMKLPKNHQNFTNSFS